jgi:hypothetical protein
MDDESAEPSPPRARGRLAAKMEKQKGRWWVTPAVVLALLLGFGVLLWVRSLPDPWIEYRDPKGRFACSFPQQPRTAEKQVPTWTGSTALDRSFIYGSAWEDEFYSVEQCSYDKAVDADKVETLFDGISDALVKALQRTDTHDATLRSKKPWSMAGQPGRELEVEVHFGGGLVVVRLLLVDHQHMFIVSTGVHEHHHGENDARFLSSFTLLR